MHPVLLSFLLTLAVLCLTFVAGMAVLHFGPARLERAVQDYWIVTYVGARYSARQIQEQLNAYLSTRTRLTYAEVLNQKLWIGAQRAYAPIDYPPFVWMIVKMVEDRVEAESRQIGPHYSPDPDYFAVQGPIDQWYLFMRERSAALIVRLLEEYEGSVKLLV